MNLPVSTLVCRCGGPLFLNLEGYYVCRQCLEYCAGCSCGADPLIGAAGYRHLRPPGKAPMGMGDDSSSKLLYWILTALLGVVMALGGFYLKGAACPRWSSTPAASPPRYETLNRPMPSAVSAWWRSKPR